MLWMLHACATLHHVTNDLETGCEALGLAHSSQRSLCKLLYFITPAHTSSLKNPSFLAQQKVKRHITAWDALLTSSQPQQCPTTCMGAWYAAAYLSYVFWCQPHLAQCWLLPPRCSHNACGLSTCIVTTAHRRE